jgi:hypothetical protein
MIVPMESARVSTLRPGFQRFLKPVGKKKMPPVVPGKIFPETSG